MGSDLSPQRLPGAVKPRCGLRQPPLAGERGAEHHVGEDSLLVLAPAVPFGQLDRLPARRSASVRDWNVATRAPYARPENSM